MKTLWTLIFTCKECSDEIHRVKNVIMENGVISMDAPKENCKISAEHHGFAVEAVPQGEAT